MRRAEDRRSGGVGPAVGFWTLTVFVAGALLIVLFLAAVAGGYLP